MRVNLGKGLLVLRTTTTLLFHLHITAHNLLLIHISILEKRKEIKCRVRHKTIIALIIYFVSPQPMDKYASDSH